MKSMKNPLDSAPQSLRSCPQGASSGLGRPGAGQAGLSLEERMRRVEDFEAIRQLKGYYAWACDAKFNDQHQTLSQAEIDDLIRPMVDAVFTEDATWTTGPATGVFIGREAIFNRLRQSNWTFAMHYYMNPLIRLDGDRATATWMLWEPCTHRDRNEAMWMSALTDDEYVRTREGWRISKYNYRAKFLTPFDKPWTKEPLAA